MRSNDPIAALEIGTSNTILAVGESEGENHVRITALGAIPSTGVRKSQIIDLGQTAHSIDAVLKSVNRDFNYAIGQTNLAVKGPHVAAKAACAQWQILGKTVTEDDLREIYNRSFDNGIDPEERILLDEALTGYGLDLQDGIPDPKGMAGRLLKRHAIFIHGDAKRIQDAQAAARLAKLDIAENYFAGTAAASAVLSAADRQAGALVLDIGGGSTAYAVYGEGHLLHAGVLGIGGDHVTNDISSAFELTKAQAEMLKKEVCAIVGGEPEASARLTVAAGTPGFDPRTVSRRALETVVNARLQELFAVVFDILDRENLTHRLAAGIVLTGGVATTRALAPLAEKVFGRRARIGTFVDEISPLEKGPLPATYASVAGLIHTIHQTRDPQAHSRNWTDLFGGFFK